MYMLQHREVIQLTALLSLETWKAVIRTALTMNMLCTCYNTERWSSWLPYCHWRLGRLSLGLPLQWICYVHATTQRGGPVDCLIVTGDLEGCHYTPRFNEVDRGVYWYHLVRLSVRPSVRLSVCGQNSVRSVSSRILIGSISYLHILSSNFRRCVACNAHFKIQKFATTQRFWRFF